MSKIKKVVITAFGDENKLAIVEADIPDPAAGQVQVTVEYSVVSGLGRQHAPWYISLPKESAEATVSYTQPRHVACPARCTLC
jgi:hypothetical protein